MHFGPSYSARHVLEDGTAVTLRLVRPEDRGEFDRQFRRLSPDSRYRRVASPKPIPWPSGPLGSPGSAPVTSRSVRDNLRT